MVESNVWLEKLSLFIIPLTLAVRRSSRVGPSKAMQTQSKV